MKKLICVFVFLLYYQNSSSQTFKEVLSFHENGNPREVIYKNDDLKIVKTQEFDLNEELVYEYNFNPLTGKKDGEFFNSGNEGFYDNGVLNCDDCSINFESWEGTNFQGRFINGRPYGKIKVSLVYPNSGKHIFDSINNYIRSMEDLDQSINYSFYKNSGLYGKTFVTELNYNENGNLDGTNRINELTTLYFDDGVLDGFIIKNEEDPTITKDSVFRNNKIWKLKNSFVKNTGWLGELKWDEFRRPWIFEYNNKESLRIGRVEKVFFGSPNSTPTESDSGIGMEVFETNKILENGIYSKKNYSNVWWDENSPTIRELNSKYRDCYSSNMISEIRDVLDRFGFNRGVENIKSVGSLHDCKIINRYLPGEIYNLIDIIDFIEINVLKHPNSQINRIWIRDGEKYRDIEDIFKELKLREEKNRIKEEQDRLREEQTKKDNLSSFLKKTHFQCPDELSQTKNYESISSLFTIDQESIEKRISEIRFLFFGDNTSTTSENFSLKEGELLKNYDRDKVYSEVIYRLDLIEDPKKDLNENFDKKVLKYLFKKHSFIRIRYVFNNDLVEILHPTENSYYLRLE